MATGGELTIDILKENTGITDNQLDRIIDQEQCRKLASLFGSCEKYSGTPGLGLEPGQIADVRDCALQHGHQVAMTKALEFWLDENPYRTYRNLIEALLELREGRLVHKITIIGEFNAIFKQLYHSLLIYHSGRCIRTEGGHTQKKASSDTTSSVVMKNKDEMICKLQQNIKILKQDLEKEKNLRLEQAKREKIIFQQLIDANEQIKQLRQQIQQLKISETKTSESNVTKIPQIPYKEEGSWNVRRQDVTILNLVLGRGSYATVYKGIFRSQQVAVKCAQEMFVNTTHINVFIREIRIMARFEHPNLVRMLAAVVDGSVERGTASPLLVLELMDTDLSRAYTETFFDRNSLIRIFQDVAYALHYLHDYQEPIIHRDVSAHNVLLQKIAPSTWKAKLTDFGTTNLAKDCKTPYPGAIGYAAPETFPPSDPCSPPQKQTTKMDVYSYGYVIFEAYVKKFPDFDSRQSMLEDLKRDWRQLYNTIIACTKHKPEDRLTMTQVLEKLNTLS